MKDDQLDREIRGLYDRWWAALPRHDRETLDEVLADDWTYTDQYGTVRGKWEYVELVERAIRPDHSTVTIDLATRLIDTVAIATGRYDVHGVIDGHDVAIRLRYTSIWKRHEDAWRCHGQHTTEIRDAEW
jgi:ketosteroid isomerase-like protein